MLVCTKNHAENYHLVPQFMLLPSLCLDRFKDWSLCKNRPNVHTCQCVFGRGFDPLEFGSNVARIYKFALKIMPKIII
jgi:hypothetical protein